jgi:coenzyme PQQ precursor peptide PqqA
MTPTPNNEPRTEVIREQAEEQPREPRPWTAPDFVERSTCAEIGAYAFQEK